MTEKGIRVYICESLDGVPEVFGIYQTDLGSNGYAFADQDLAELKQEIWDAAREIGVYDVHGHDLQVYIHSNLEDYELSKASKKDGQDD